MSSTGCGTILDLAPALLERRLGAALEADARGDIDGAMRQVELALVVAPREPRAHALAAVYRAMRDEERAALGHARRALRLRGGCAEIAYWAAVARHIVGAHALALEALDLAQALSPSDRAVRRLRASCELALGRAANDR